MGELGWVEDSNKIKPKRKLPESEIAKESALRGTPEILTSGLNLNRADLGLAKEIIATNLEKIANFQHPEKAAAIEITIRNLNTEGGEALLKSLDDELLSKGGEVTPEDVANEYMRKFNDRFRAKKVHQ